MCVCVGFIFLALSTFILLSVLKPTKIINVDVKFTSHSLPKSNSLGNLAQITKMVFGTCRKVPSMKTSLNETGTETIHFFSCGAAAQRGLCPLHS